MIVPFYTHRRELERAREQMLELQKQQTTVSTQREQDMQAVEGMHARTHTHTHAHTHTHTHRTEEAESASEGNLL